jgi:RNA12 protein
LLSDSRWEFRLMVRSLTASLIVEALKDIIDQSAYEILKLYFLGGSVAMKWTQEQAWMLVKILSTAPQVGYNAVLLDPIFAQNEAPLRELAQAELITISSSPEGRPTVIKPGRPVFSAAFALLVGDKGFNAQMELGRLTFLAGEQKKNIEKAEEELAKLNKLTSGQIKGIEPRIRYLLNKIQTSQKNIELFEHQIGMVKEVLKTEV